MRSIEISKNFLNLDSMEIRKSASSGKNWKFQILLFRESALHWENTKLSLQKVRSKQKNSKFPENVIFRGLNTVAASNVANALYCKNHSLLWIFAFSSQQAGQRLVNSSLDHPSTKWRIWEVNLITSYHSYHYPLITFITLGPLITLITIYQNKIMSRKVGRSQGNRSSTGNSVQDEWRKNGFWVE